MSRWNPQTIEERFADSHIPEPNSGCFLWVKSVDAYGYGDFVIRKIPLGDSRYKKERIKAHRLAWQLRASTESLSVVAERYGVAFQTVSEIRRRKIWKHI
jgi:hypothetical protein